MSLNLNPFPNFILFISMFCLNLFGSLFVSIGFWLVIVPYSIIFGYYGLPSYTFNPFDLIGHLFNFIFVMIEFKMIPETQMRYTTLFLMLIILLHYTIIMKVLQECVLICWIPYGPLLVHNELKLLSGGIIVLIFILIKKKTLKLVE